jgi:hypothetical protein
MSKYNRLFYTGFFIVVGPIIIFLTIISMSLFANRTQSIEPELPKFYDTVKVQVKEKVTVYDTVKVEKIKYIEKLKPQLDSL